MAPRITRLALLAVAISGGTVAAQDYLRDHAEVEALLSGATLSGIYLRSQSAYVLEFHPDGSLVDGQGASARWWVSDSGQYCREWLSGRLAGNKACMDLTRDGDQIAIYSNGNRVAEGTLSR